jgi:hypothetical protein
MTHMDMTEFVKLMTSLGILYGKPMSEQLIDIYWQALQAFSFREAFNAHVRNPDTGQYLPKPADVVRYIEGSGITQALQAWSQVVRTIRSVGCYESVVFDDPIIHAVIEDMGGWLQLCKVTEKDLPFRAQEFEKRYQGYIVHPPHQFPKQLAGLIESCNHLQGYPKEDPLLIGDIAQAHQIYQQGYASNGDVSPLKLNTAIKILDTLRLE